MLDKETTFSLVKLLKNSLSHVCFFTHMNASKRGDPFEEPLCLYNNILLHIVFIFCTKIKMWHFMMYF